MSDITNIEEARVLRRAGLPLNLPIQYRTFAEESSRRYFALWDDLTKFCLKMYGYNDDPTLKNYKAWKRTLIKMDRHAAALFDYATGLKNVEGEILLRFLLERVTPFTEGWAETFAALEDGEKITIQPIDKWIWSPLARG